MLPAATPRHSTAVSYHCDLDEGHFATYYDPGPENEDATI